MSFDPYEILGVSRKATEADIRKAYRDAAKLAHPDVGGTEEGFARLGKALYVLTNAEARERFDRSGEINERSASNPDTPIWAMITALLVEFICADNMDPCATDMVVALRLKLDEKIEEGNQQLASLQVRKGRVEAMLKRFKLKAVRKDEFDEVEPDHMADVLRAQLVQLDRAIATVKVPVGQLVRAKNLLSDYEFEADLPRHMGTAQGLKFSSFEWGRPTGTG